MLINALDAEEHRIAVVEDGVLQELHVEIANREAYLGNIYKGKVVNIEPSIGAAFVSFGGRTNGFLHVSDVLPAYGREGFALDDVIEGRARVDEDGSPDNVRAALSEEEAEASGAKGRKGSPKSRGASQGDDGADRDEEADADGDVALATAELDESLDIDPADVDGVDDADDDGDEDDDGPSAEDGAEDGAGEAAAAGDDGDTKAKGGGRKAVRTKGGGKRRSRPRAKRASVPIDKLLRKGQEVVVQITKEGIGTKGPTLTTYISLPGRSLVLMPSLPKCGVSRKIEDVKERRRLKKIVKNLDETGNGGIGFIVRTAGVDKSQEDLERDRDYLKKIWELVGHRTKATRAPALLYQESDLVLKAMRDLFSPEIADVVVDSREVFLRIKDFAEKLMPHMADRIKLHELVSPLFHSFGIEGEVQTLYQSKVELKNGASIVIDQAEALVAIDVNSGKFKGDDLEETAYRTNLDVIPEIVRHLRLRDLGGLIVIDFIDMNTERHRRGVERKMMEALRGDRARIKLGRISPFGMMELTRQRVGPGLKRTVFATCHHCKGQGLVRTVQSKALAVLREVRALLNLKGFSMLQVFVSPPVNDFLVNYKRRQLLDLEEEVGKGIMFKAEPSYPVEHVHYRFLTGDGQQAKVAIPAGLGVKT